MNQYVFLIAPLASLLFFTSFDGTKLYRKATEKLLPSEKIIIFCMINGCLFWSWNAMNGKSTLFLRSLSPGPRTGRDTGESYGENIDCKRDFNKFSCAISSSVIISTLEMQNSWATIFFLGFWKNFHFRPWKINWVHLNIVIMNFAQYLCFIARRTREWFSWLLPDLNSSPNGNAIAAEGGGRRPSRVAKNNDN